MLDWKTPPRLVRHSVVPSQPPFPTTQVSWLAVLTKRSTHCGGVPTLTETGLQLPSYPNQSVLTGIDTAEGFGAAAVKATALKHRVVSSRRSKMLQIPLFIAAALGSRGSISGLSQYESMPGMLEVKGEDETMSSTKEGIEHLIRHGKFFTHSNETVKRNWHNRYSNPCAKTRNKRVEQVAKKQTIKGGN